MSQAGPAPPAPEEISPAPFHGVHLSRAAGSILVLVGIGIRLVQFLARRPLWIDEASLAVNIVGRPLREALRPFPNHQSAPPLFLALEWALSSLLGVHEWTLRILPFLAGIGLLLVLHRLSRHIRDPLVSLWFLAFVAGSPLLVYYANELKPYGVDAFVAGLLLWLVFAIHDAPDRRARWASFAICGAISVWLSAPAVFAYAACTASLIWHAAADRSRTAIRWACATAASGLLSFGAAYGMFYRRFQGDAYLARYWSSTFLDPRSRDFARAFRSAAEEIVRSFFITGARLPYNWAITLAAILVLTIGGFSWVRRCGVSFGIATVGPVLICLGLSALHLYPVFPRLMLFAAAPLFLMAAEGLQCLGGVFPSRLGRAAFAALLGLTLFRPARLVYRWTIHPPRIEDSRPLIEEIGRRRAPGEPIYVAVRGAPAWLFYTTDWTRPDRARVSWYIRETGADGPAFENAPSRGRVVDREGDDLVFRNTPRGDELLGTPTGMQSTPSGFLSRAPDPGWASNEARRIRATAHPTAWLFFSHSIDPSEGELLEELRRAGGRLIYRRLADGCQIYRITFDEKRP